MQYPEAENLIGRVIDDVVITAKLGQGGMGTVYLGQQSSLNRRVCVKFMLPELISEPRFFKRFHREAKVLASIKHPHVIQVYSCGIFQDTYPYLTMEYAEGTSLRELICTNKTLDWQRSCQIVRQICSGLEAVHAAGFIHRDLKPDNVLLANASDGTDFAKIIDFGLSGFDRRTTMTGTFEMIGSVHYMAPECYSMSQNSKSVDIYAAGCILYECLVGQPPFAGSSFAEIAYQHANSPVPDLPSSVGAPLVRQALQAVIAKCCAKNPQKRFNSTTEMRSWLDQIGTGELQQVTLDNLLIMPPIRQQAVRTKIILSALSVLLLSCFVAVFHREISLAFTQVKACLICLQFDLSKNHAGLLQTAKDALKCKDFDTCQSICTLKLQPGNSDLGSLEKIDFALILAESDLYSKKLDAAPKALTAAASILALDLTASSAQSASTKHLEERVVAMLRLLNTPVHTTEQNELKVAPMARLCSANFPSSELVSIQRDLKAIFESKVLSVSVRSDVGLALAKMLWEGKSYEESLLTIASVVDTLTAEFGSNREEQSARDKWKQKNSTTKKGLPELFEMSCMELAAQQCTCNHPELALPYLTLLRLTDRTRYLDGNLALRMRLVADHKLEDAFEPSIWEVVSFKKAFRASFLNADEKSTLQNSLHKIALREFPSKHFNEVYDHLCLAGVSPEAAVGEVVSRSPLNARSLMANGQFDKAAELLLQLLHSEPLALLARTKPEETQTNQNRDEDALVCVIEEWFGNTFNLPESKRASIRNLDAPLLTAWRSALQQYYVRYGPANHCRKWFLPNWIAHFHRWLNIALLRAPQTVDSRAEAECFKNLAATPGVSLRSIVALHTVLKCELPALYTGPQRRAAIEATSSIEAIMQSLLAKSRASLSGDEYIQLLTLAVASDTFDELKQGHHETVSKKFHALVESAQWKSLFISKGEPAPKNADGGISIESVMEMWFDSDRSAEVRKNDRWMLQTWHQVVCKHFCAYPNAGDGFLHYQRCVHAALAVCPQLINADSEIEFLKEVCASASVPVETKYDYCKEICATLSKRSEPRKALAACEFFCDYLSRTARSRPVDNKPESSIELDATMEKARLLIQAGMKNKAASVILDVFANDRLKALCIAATPQQKSQNSIAPPTPSPDYSSRLLSIFEAAFGANVGTEQLDSDNTQPLLSAWHWLLTNTPTEQPEHYTNWLRVVSTGTSLRAHIDRELELKRCCQVVAHERIPLNQRLDYSTWLLTLFDNCRDRKRMNYLMQVLFPRLVKDQRQSTPSLPFAAIVTYPEHYLNNGLLAEAMELSNLLEKRAGESNNAPVDVFLQGMWGLRIGACAEDSEKCRRSCQLIRKSLARLVSQQEIEPSYRHLTADVTALMECGQRKVALERLKQALEDILKSVPPTARAAKFTQLLPTACAIAFTDAEKKSFKATDLDCITLWYVFVYATVPVYGTTIWRELPTGAFAPAGFQPYRVKPPE